MERRHGQVITNQQRHITVSQNESAMHSSSGRWAKRSHTSGNSWNANILISETHFCPEHSQMSFRSSDTSNIKLATMASLDLLNYMNQQNG